MTHYESFYGQQFPSMVSYPISTSKVNVMDTLLQNHEVSLAMLKENLAMTQNCMKKQTNQHCSKFSFEEEDQAFLHLQPYQTIYLIVKSHQKCHVQMKLPELDEEGSL